MRPPEQTGQDTGPAQRLAVEAARAARVRALSTDPDVIALRVERVRVQVDRLMWSGIVLGLGFTMTNVAAFAAAGAPPWSTAWVAAWALDPMVSLVLIAVLRAEQTTARWQIRTGPWVRRARWGTLAATYAMNTWSAWADGTPAQVVLHSVPPLVVFVAAEAVTGLREALTEAVHAAAGAHRAQPAPGPGPDTQQVDSAAARSQVAAPDQAGEQEELDAAAAACLLGVTEDEILIRQRHGGLPDRLTVAALSDDASAPRDGPQEPSTADDADAPAAADERVVALVELLAAGTPVTGVQAAVLFGCSARTGRRLLTRAQSTRPLPRPDRDPSPDSTNVLQLPARGWS